jgi:hypothetical protein
VCGPVPTACAARGCLFRPWRSVSALIRISVPCLLCAAEGAARFELWWGHAAQHGLCYSFECVSPRVLGDHGATPRAAYMVLTAISLTAEERYGLKHLTDATNSCVARWLGSMVAAMPVPSERLMRRTLQRVACRFASPLELLELATMWHLPLNEAWYFDEVGALAVDNFSADRVPRVPLSLRAVQQSTVLGRVTSAARTLLGALQLYLNLR